MTSSRMSAGTVDDSLDDRATDVNPFPGPKAYRKADTKYFFGREDEIEELASLILSTGAVLLFGPSGAGKSSLLDAGLVPYLERRFKVAILPTVHLGASALADDTAGNRFVRTVCEAIAASEEQVSSLCEIGALAGSYRTAGTQRVLLIRISSKRSSTDRSPGWSGSTSSRRSPGRWPSVRGSVPWFPCAATIWPR
jgi:hypothetical protein